VSGHQGARSAADAAEPLAPSRFSLPRKGKRLPQPRAKPPPPPAARNFSARRRRRQCRRCYRTCRLDTGGNRTLISRVQTGRLPVRRRTHPLLSPAPSPALSLLTPCRGWIRTSDLLNQSQAFSLAELRGTTAPLRFERRSPESESGVLPVTPQGILFRSGGWRGGSGKLLLPTLHSLLSTPHLQSARRRNRTGDANLARSRDSTSPVGRSFLFITPQAQTVSLRGGALRPPRAFHPHQTNKKAPMPFPGFGAKSPSRYLLQTISSSTRAPRRCPAGHSAQRRHRPPLWRLRSSGVGCSA
jgi:hypothetical protein